MAEGGVTASPRFHRKPRECLKQKLSGNSKDHVNHQEKMQRKGREKEDTWDPERRPLAPRVTGLRSPRPP